MEWFDGGYREGERVISDSVEYILLISLGTLGWIVEDVRTKKRTILMFGEVVDERSTRTPLALLQI
jgi:hypothetical protein